MHAPSIKNPQRPWGLAGAIQISGIKLGLATPIGKRFQRLKPTRLQNDYLSTDQIGPYPVDNLQSSRFASKTNSHPGGQGMLDQISGFFPGYWTSFFSSIGQVWDVSPGSFATIFLMPILGVPVVYGLLSILSLFLTKTSHPSMSIRIRPDIEEETVFLNRETMNKLFGSGVRPDGVILRGNKRVYSNLGLRYSNTLGLDWIEIHPITYRKLFPKDEIPEKTTDDSPLQKKMDIRPYGTTGLVGYWLAPNSRLRFQNRFAIYLGCGLLAAQFLIEFMVQHSRGITHTLLTLQN